MKTSLSLSLRSALIAALFSPVMLSAQSEESRSVGEFTGIRSYTGVEIQISQDMSCAVKVTAEDAEDLPHIKTVVENGVLIISNEGRIKKDVDVKVNIKNLTLLELGGACEAGSINQLAVENLVADLSGAAESKLDIQGGNITARLSGASELTLKGKGKMLDANLSGASELKAYEYQTDSARIVASGASEARVKPGTIDATATGASEIRYEGSPVVTRSDASGGSEIRGRNAADSTHSHHFDIDNDFDKHHKHNGGGDYKFWSGFDIHVDGYLNRDNTIELPASYNFLEQNYAKSIGFSLNVFQKNIPIIKPYAKLYTGLGFGFYNYSFRNDITLLSNSNVIAASVDSIDYRTNKLKTAFVHVPLMLEFNTNGKDEDQSFHFAGGVTFGYNVLDNRLRQRFGENGDNRKRTIRDDFNINPVRLDLSARIGYGDFSIFGNYALTTLFNKGEGPSLYPFSAGVSFSFD